MNTLFSNKPTMIGMIHLPPLPGYEKHPGMDAVIQKALTDLKTLQDAGFDAVLVENDNDQPHQIHVTDEITRAFSHIMSVLLKHATIPVGMEIIYDMPATVEVAAQVHADFVRLDVFVDTIATKWGGINAQAKKLTALKKKLFADDLVFLTDIHVKHATLIEPNKSITQSAEQAIKAGSNGLIVTGNLTGEAPSLEDLNTVKEVSGTVPVFVGSGFSSLNAKELLHHADGAIVGTLIKHGEYISRHKSTTLIQTVKLGGEIHEH